MDIDDGAGPEPAITNVYFVVHGTDARGYVHRWGIDGPSMLHRWMIDGPQKNG